MLIITLLLSTFGSFGQQGLAPNTIKTYPTTITPQLLGRECWNCGGMAKVRGQSGISKGRHS